MKFLSRLAALLLFFCFTATLHAQPLADKVPANAVFYLGWSGADALAPAYQKSALKGLMDATNLRANTATIVTQLLAKYGPKDAESTAAINQAFATGGLLWHHPMALYVGPLEDFDPKTNDTPHMGFIIDAGADADVLEKQIQDALAKQPPDPKKFSFTRTGTLLTFRAGPLVTPFVALADSPDFKAALAAASPTAPGIDAYVGYIDFPRIITFADRATTATSTPDDIAQWKSFRQASNVDAIGRMAFRGVMTDQGWDDAAFLGLGANRTGIFTLVNGKPVDNALLKLIPQDSAAMDATRADLNAEWLAIRAIMAQTDPAAVTQLDAQLAQAQQTTGVDVQKQIIGALGDSWVDYKSAGLGGGSIFINVLKDPDAFSTALKSLEEVFNKQAATGNPGVAIRSVTMGDLQIKTLAVQTFQLSWTIADGKLFASTTPRLIAKAVANVQKQLAGDAPNISTNADYQAVQKNLATAVGDGSVINLSYNDLRQTVPEKLLALQMYLGIANMMGANISPDLLPSVDQVTPFLAPCGAITWVDAAGVHARIHTPFPGAELFGGGGAAITLGALAFGTATFIPSLGRAKELANRSADGASLSGIAKACTIYSAENSDQMPDHLAQLIARGDIGPKQLLSKNSATAPLVLTDDQKQAALADWKTIKDDVDKHCDVIYCGAGTKTEADASIPLVFGKPGLHREGTEVAFQDTHVEWIKMKDLPALIEVMNAYRRKNNLAEIKIEIPANLLPQPTLVPDKP